MQRRESYDYENELVTFICIVTELHFDAIPEGHHRTILHTYHWI